jgi:hypothetical protein
MNFIIMGALSTALYFVYIKLGLVPWRTPHEKRITLGSILFCLTILAIPYFNIGFIVTIGVISIFEGRLVKYEIDKKVFKFLDKELF